MKPTRRFGELIGDDTSHGIAWTEEAPGQEVRISDDHGDRHCFSQDPSQGKEGTRPYPRARVGQNDFCDDFLPGCPERERGFFDIGRDKGDNLPAASVSVTDTLVSSGRGTSAARLVDMTLGFMNSPDFLLPPIQQAS